MTKKRTNNIKLIDLILPNKKINIFVITVLMLGVISGSIFLMMSNSADKTSVTTQINNFLLISYITMLTRCKIIKAIDEIGVDRWVYSDTDSIKLIGELTYNVGLNLGQYKNEGQAEIAMFYHPKAYFWNNEFTFAGVSKDKTKDIDYKEIKDGFIIESGKKKPTGVTDGIELEDVNYMIGE